jgi:hypothetical protein
MGRSAFAWRWPRGEVGDQNDEERGGAVRSVAMAMAMDRGWIPACVGTADGEVLGWPARGGVRWMFVGQVDAKCARAQSTEGRPFVKDLGNVRGKGNEVCAGFEAVPVPCTKRAGRSR